MKKANAFVCAVFTALFFFSCSDALLDDGTHVKKYTSSTGGAGGAIPFHMYNDIMDLQIWTTDANGQPNGGGANSSTTKEELVITQTGEWWGLAICSDAAGSDTTEKAKIYDMSEVAKVTFMVKSDKATEFWLSGCDDANKKTVTITDEYPDEPFEIDFSKKIEGTHYAIVCIGGQKTDATWYIKNIAFYDASGNEIVPTISK